VAGVSEPSAIALELAKQQCKELVEQARSVLSGTNGAIFSAHPRQPLKVVAMTSAKSGWEPAPLENAARFALYAGTPLASMLEHSSQQGPIGSTERCIVLRLELDGDVLGALVVSGLPSPSSPLDVQLDRLGALPELVALILDRHRTLSALDGRGRELTALRQQLDAFALDFRATYDEERQRSQQLAGTLLELEHTYRSTVSSLALAVEAKDERTGGHLYRVSRYGLLLTQLVSPEHAKDPQFEYGFLLHDIGKLMVPDAVLNKPGPLSEAEWELMRAHPAKGRSILEGIDFLDGAREIIHAHHERWDGNGYPRRLQGTDIPLGARIFPICDAFDAMTTNRPYRTAMPLGTAQEDVREGSGTQFWPEAVEAFLTIPDDVLKDVMNVKRRSGGALNEDQRGVA
jgi:HD-GYP domain-containing protein (c-di-GMP phosphodiesterase class II)